MNEEPSIPPDDALDADAPDAGAPAEDAPEEAAPEEAAPAPRKKRGRPRRGQELPTRYLLDSRLFRLFCSPGGEEALEGFRASLQRHGLAPEGGLPPLELTPMAFLEVIDIELPELDPFPLPPSVLKSGESVMATSVIVRLAIDRFRESPGIATELLA